MIKILLKEYKEIIANFSFLSILQFVQLAVTFILYPYLIKILGQDKYGVIAYAQAISGYFIIIINYGFKATATKEIANNKNDLRKTNEIISAVFGAKIFLFLFSSLIIFLLVYNIQFLLSYKWIYLLTFFSTIGWVLFPDWYFQGIEKMHNITYAMVISKVLSVVFIFSFVKNSSHIYLVPIINSLSMILCGMIGIFLLTSNKNIKLTFPKIDEIKEQYKIGFAYFSSNIAANTKDYLNTIIVGAFLNYTNVAIYDLANKLVKILILPCSILANAIFPRVTIKKSFSFNLKIEKIMLFYSILISTSLFIIPDEIWTVFIKENLTIFKTTLYILSLTLPLLSLTASRGFLILVGFNKDKYFTISVLFSMLGYFIFIGYLIYLHSFNLYTAALAIVISLLIEVSFHIYGIKLSKLRR
jgi:PST family polysaccharide transporter